MAKEIKLTAEQIESALHKKMVEMQYEANKEKYIRRFERLVKDMAKDNLKFFRHDSWISVKDWDIYISQLKG